MSKVLVNETSLSGIANSIRAKNGTETTYKPSEMAAAIDAIQTGGTVEALDVTANGTYTAPEGVDGYSPITVNVPQDGSPPESAFVISGNCSYRFAYDGWSWFINKYGNKITTKNIKEATFMFAISNSIKNIPFEINFSTSEMYHDTNRLFTFCRELTESPNVNNLKPYNISYLFNECNKLRTIPDDFADTWDWSYIKSMTSQYTGSQQNIFTGCYSLRSVPMSIVSHGNPNLVSSYSYFYGGFQNCYVLNELVNLPIPYTKATWTSSAFQYTFDSCSRLKNITFALQDDGTVYVVKWKSQTIDLTKYVGYSSSNTYILNYNSGITADKEVTDDTTYQALKNDPDWYAVGVAYGLPYSRYNHDSAVATINSLPDTSAYLATAGGTNTIKFKGESGSATDGGAISSLTPEEIAVAAAKGWTVTLV